MSEPKKILTRPPYEVWEIEPGFWSIEEGMVRCFLFEGEEYAILADTGFGAGDLKAVVSELTDKPVRVFTTHGDGDHISGHAAFGKAYVHPAEFARIERRDPGPDFELVPPWGGTLFELGTRTLEVVELPGHTPGSMGLLDSESGFLIGGDGFQSGPVFMFGAGRSISALKATAEMLQGRMDEFDRIYPSHGDLCIPAENLADIIEAARLQLAGELTKEDTDNGMPCKIVRYGKAAFYVDL